MLISKNLMMIKKFAKKVEEKQEEINILLFYY